MTSKTSVDMIVKGILGSQILSVPIACALTSASVILACRFISKTSTNRPAQRRYFEYQAGSSRPIRMILARAGAVIVAGVCVLMTIMELSIIYQTAIIHPAEAEYKDVVPWTSSFVPLLTAIASVATQTYFSDKILHQVQRPKLFFPFLAILSLGSLLLGTAATIALLIKPFNGPTAKGIPAAEALFWAYLIMTTISSVVISFILVGSFLRDRRAARMIAKRAGDADHGPTIMNTILRFFLSTYTLVFMFDITCLITIIVSASPNFQTAFNASVAFLVLQKMMVRMMAVSYLYALLDGIPQNLIFVPTNDAPHLKALFVTPSSEHGFTAPKSQSDTERVTKSKFKTLHSSVNRALSKYENVKNKNHPTHEEEGEIFNYSYPPHSASSMVPYNKTPASASFPYDSVSHNLSLEKGPKSSRRSHYNLSPVPNPKSYQTYSQPHFLPNLPPIPPQFRETQPLPALPRNPQ